MSITGAPPFVELVMPLIQVMARTDLSWRDRERIAAAINACNMAEARITQKSVPNIRESLQQTFDNPVPSQQVPNPNLFMTRNQAE